MRRILELGGAAAAAFLTGLVLFHLGMLAFVRSSTETKVPDLVGLDLAEARAELQRQGFTGVVDREENSTDFGEGRVVEQRPAAGKVLRKGRKVYLTISLGVRKSVVPNLVGLSYRQAGIVLRGSGLAKGGVSRLHHPGVPRGAVIAQDPPSGSSCAEGARVDLLVSLGVVPEAYVLPDLTGRSVQDVESFLRGRGLRIGATTVLIDHSVLPSTVLEHDPPPGSRIDREGRIDLVISSRR